MASSDFTYCWASECRCYACKRHYENAPDTQFLSWADLSKDCPDYTLKLLPGDLESGAELDARQGN